ncbi:MAG TPA: type I DNA topoisomerase, partial [Rhizomicrobium sp.]|nr:type I DNA topoisomerase [Rhizomicrobium sp.]
TKDGVELTATLHTVDGKRLATGKDFDGTGKLIKADALVLDEAGAQALATGLEGRTLEVSSIERKPYRRTPSPPFMTSTLQQEASRKLRFSAQRTMKAAQRLYEGGHITYMRTDSTTLSETALSAARRTIETLYGAEHVPPAPRTYANKVKNAQEAHEAIRPTSFARRPEMIARRLDADQAKLYELIWKRALASQMESAELERTTVDVVSADNKITLRATGSVTLFDGFLTLYQEGKDDEQDEDGARLPRVKEGESAGIEQVNPEQHFTEPPPRYSEATLVRKMEEMGIGRPSTYASILSTLRDRAYVRMERNRFVPDDKGRIVTTFLTNFFKRYVEYGFTADLEEKLDEVSAGALDWKQLLRDFWRDFSAAIGETKELKISDVIDALDEVLGPHLFVPVDGEDPRVCPTCGNGRLSLKLGRFGAFVGCSNYPDCRYTRKLGQSAEEANSEQPRELGVDPETGEAITLRTGRFGPYVQRGEGDKPARGSIPKGIDASAIDLEYALRLLSLPREIGKHPETGEPITANFGRFGPYVQHQKTYASLETPEDVFTVGINRAVTLIAEKKANPRGRRGPEPLKELGASPITGAAIKLMNGRYGPYVTDGSTNATIPNGTDPQSVTLDQAIALIAEREAKGGGKKKTAAKPKAAKAKTATNPAKARAAKPRKRASASKKPEPVET